MSRVDQLVSELRRLTVRSVEVLELLTAERERGWNEADARHPPNRLAWDQARRLGAGVPWERRYPIGVPVKITNRYTRNRASMNNPWYDARVERYALVTGTSATRRQRRVNVSTVNDIATWRDPAHVRLVTPEELEEVWGPAADEGRL